MAYRSTASRLGLYTAVALVAMAVSGVVLALVFRGPDERRAIVVSGLVALAAQLAAFVIARHAVGDNVIAGWGLGVGLRFVVLAVYAFVVVGALALPQSAALLSLVTFLFVSTLVEPPFLKP